MSVNNIAVPVRAVVEAFDGIAADYDRVFTESQVGRAQRQAVWEVLDRCFAPGQSVLDLNCGTGEDARRLAARGVHVHACDVSRNMIDVARRRGGSGIRYEVRAIEDIGSLNAAYHGVLSNFGGLNCVSDLAPVARNLARLVRPGGALLLGFMGPLCAWETAWYAAHGQFPKATRRWKRSNVDAHVGQGRLLVHYPTARSLARLLAPAFRLVEWKGIGIAVPPSYVEGLAARHPGALRFASRLDRAIAGWPLLRALADHQLLRFERVEA